MTVDIPTLVAWLALLVMLAIAARFIGPRPGDASVVSDSLFRSPTDLGWPRGVQEEDPLPWRLELLSLGRGVTAGQDVHVAPAADPAGRVRTAKPGKRAFEC